VKPNFSRNLGSENIAAIEYECTETYLVNMLLLMKRMMSDQYFDKKDFTIIASELMPKNVIETYRKKLESQKTAANQSIFNKIKELYDLEIARKRALESSDSEE
jgi:N-acetylglutamate synthase-like GNAT family acetyltransferase